MKNKAFDGEHPEIRASVRAGATWLTVSNIVCALLHLLQLSILARLLSPHDYALMAITVAIIGLVGLYSEFGASAAIIHDRDTSAEQLSTLYWLNVILGVIGAIAITLFSPFAATFFGEPGLSSILPMTGAVLVISSISGQFRALNQKQLRFRVLAIGDMAAAVIAAASSIALSFAGAGVYSLALGMVAGATASAWIHIQSQWREHHPTLRFKPRSVVGLVRFGMYQVGSDTLNYITGQVDVLVLGRIIGGTPLGYYSTSKQLGSRPLAFVNPIFTKLALPVFSAIRSDRATVSAAYLQGLRMICGLTFPIYCALAITADPVVAVFLGEKWADAGPILSVLAGYFLIASSGNPVGSLLSATGHVQRAFIWNLAFAIVFPIAVICGSQYGAIGVAWALLVLQSALVIPNWYFLVYKTCGISFRRYFSTLLVPFALSCVAAIAGVMVRGRTEGPVSELIVTLCVFMATYAVLAVIFLKDLIHQVLSLIFHPIGLVRR